MEEAIEKILKWAEGHIENLTRDMMWQEGEMPGLSRGYWKAYNKQTLGTIRARATSALAFLERYAGNDSRWTKDAHDVFNNKGENQSMESGARAIGEVLKEWIDMVRSGQIQPRLSDSFSVRAASSTDLLEQVRVLNEDEGIDPAAPIVLAGAALEIALRSAVEELDLTVDGHSSINTCAQTLRRSNVLNKQDIKDVTQMAGLRNAAAHGEHDQLSREQAGLMEQQVNLFLARLDDAVQQLI